MSHPTCPTCPTCDTRLTASELRSGWCEACGKKIPEFVRATAPAPDGGAPKAAGPSWGALLGGGVLALLGVALIGLTLFTEPSSTSSRSRRVRALEELLGKQGTGVLCGLVLLGAGGFVALKCPEE
jgi:hypothetical protein